MAEWRRQFAALEIGHLRSPAVRHRDPNPYEALSIAPNMQCRSWRIIRVLFGILFMTTITKSD
ncbi:MULTISPECIES: hypothetical protein [unclassified Microcoleus]|uniref:hypothetical protein n=1 Tax=unclassified Microcoleus TaxID=2642155 RepID=UPI002FD3BE4A